MGSDCQFVHCGIHVIYRIPNEYWSRCISADDQQRLVSLKRTFQRAAKFIN